MKKSNLDPALPKALTLSFDSAVAETAEKEAIGAISMNGAFELRGVLPEGDQLTPLSEEPGYYLASLSAGGRQADHDHFHRLRGADVRCGSAQ